MRAGSSYCLLLDEVMEMADSVSEQALRSGRDSPRVSQAHSRAAHRLRRQRGLLRPLGLAAILAVVVGTLNGHPAPGGHGARLLVSVALAVYAVTVAVVIRDSFTRLPYGAQAAAIAAMALSGVAIAALQPRSATDLAAGAAVWMSVARLPLAPGIATAAATTAALGVTSALAGSSAGAVLAATLLCALLGLIAYFLKQAREGQDRTELLLAELQDAREQQTRAAAIAERGRIAGELHDVLAHALSAAALQLQGARVLAERDGAGEGLRDAIDRAAELVKDGLTDARQAVGALRGERLPGVDGLAALVEGFREDLGAQVILEVHGNERTLPEEAGLALYRGAQEALTNVARYAPGARTEVRLRYEPGRVSLTVEDTVPIAAAAHVSPGSLTGVGGGRGLDGMRERVERAGGRMRAGPTGSGWRVQLEVPA